MVLFLDAEATFGGTGTATNFAKSNKYLIVVKDKETLEMVRETNNAEMGTLVVNEA